MKKKTYQHVILISVFAVLLLLFCASAGAEEAWKEETHTTTLMVYMCGSDLESRLGSASGDITEMLASGFDTENTHLLIMAGGTQKWHMGFDPGKTSIAEIGPRGLRTLWRSEKPMNMTESGTLSAFLNYAYENYPAERYALIIWDHGGGPNEGTCYDELFPGQTLTLNALQDALKESKIGGTISSGRNKLSWVGFDACLMASVETAYMLEDYAEYMIASQAEEPAAGWNYTFLNSLEKDKDTLQTAQRIIDSYFEGQEDKETLTLSCIDLSKMWAVRNAMNGYFDSLYPILTDDTYSKFSRDRHHTRSFGRAEYDDAADYDMVDLLSLIEENEENAAAGDILATAIRSAVAISDSNTEGANGLSIYHPCYNRLSYTGKWQQQYNSSFSGLSDSYLLYMKRFGNILTGKQLGNWSGMETVRTVEENGNIRFSLTLTDEQAAYFEHATLLTVEQIYANEELQSSFHGVWETPYLEPDENNTLSAVYPGKAVYVVDDVTGEQLAGPIDYLISRDGKLVIFARYTNGFMDLDILEVRYICSFKEDSNDLEVESICAYNDATKDYSLRMELGQDYIRKLDKSRLEFWIDDCRPTYKGDELLGYKDWLSNSGSYTATVLQLPHSWHFEVAGNPEHELVFASFQVTDTQSQMHSSSLKRVYPENVTEIDVRLDEVALPDEITLHPTTQFYKESGRFVIQMNPSDLSGQIYSYEARNLIVNGEIVLKGENTSAYGEDLFMITLNPDNLLGIPELKSLEFDLEMGLRDYSVFGESHIRLLFPAVSTRTEEKILASCETDGLQWKILSVEQNSYGSIEIRYEVCNISDETKDVKAHHLILENYMTSAYNSLTIEPGSVIRDVWNAYESSADVSNSWAEFNSVRDLFTRLGIESIQTIRFFYQDREGQFVPEKEAKFTLPEAVPITPIRNADTNLLDRELLEENGLQLVLDKLTLFYDYDKDVDIVSLALWLYNNTEKTQYFTFDHFLINQIPTSDDHIRSSLANKNMAEVCSGTRTLYYLQFEIPEGESVKTVGFRARVRKLLDADIELDYLNLQEGY